ncbi:glycosyltransferase family protein [Vibrio hannami]|uniref:MJ1255/VC2487 family glycosyltransferase n=1 Tax=Vibrio hannami TaxID=2717094 RepID=UPI00240FCDA8|nr:MJ1255/VC2487 family glycosyltransferase [Vibrio hannami]MDG3087081.1 glycosyltransferase family protein [Vibrio hannami]
MKILYGVQGTGNGHSARARAMAYALKERNVDVDFLFSGREESKYFSMEAFGDYQTRQGLTFVTEQGRINYVKTAFNNNILKLHKEVKELDLSAYDLVVNDFEPISAWAAKLQKVPCIGISHQNAFRFDVPKKGESWLDQSIIKNFAPADFLIGLHWYHFGQPILPPIVHTNHHHNVAKEAFVLVYLPFESAEDITALLLRFMNQKFICYHPDINDEQVMENIHLKPLSHSNFQRDLHKCQGVIANGGFELPSESLILGKKLLLKPLSGQFEQESNVATLETLGLANSMDHLDPTAVRTWLDEQDTESVNYPDVAGHIADWLLEGDWEVQEGLWKSLWDKVDFPSHAVIHD